MLWYIVVPQMTIGVLWEWGMDGSYISRAIGKYELPVQYALPVDNFQATRK